jgi:hypothetical protein
MAKRRDHLQHARAEVVFGVLFNWGSLTANASTFYFWKLRSVIDAHLFLFLQPLPSPTPMSSDNPEISTAAQVIYDALKADDK